MRPSAGISFKPDYFEALCAAPAEGLWVEVHAENYMVAGGRRLSMLAAIRGLFPLSIHAVGTSLGSHERPDPEHLSRLRSLVERYDPFIVSEHLAWSRLDGICFPDLLPVVRTREALDAVTRNVAIVQNVLGRQLLIENPAHYLSQLQHSMPEPDFLSELVERTGCGLLIDVSNIRVSSRNLGFDARRYIEMLPGHAIGAVHLAGSSEDPLLGEGLLIDSHDRAVSGEAWALFELLVERHGPCPTLVERDSDLPPLAELMAERNRAQRIIAGRVPAKCPSC